MVFSESGHSGGFKQNAVANLTEAAVKTAISYVTDKSDGSSNNQTKNYGDPARVLELVIVNGTKENSLRHVGEYFAHGHPYKGLHPLNINPDESSVAVVTDMGAAWLSWVAGSFKYKIDGTEYFLYLGFTNPPAFSYKHYVAVKKEDDADDVSYGHDQCKDDTQKQLFDRNSGFYVTSTKHEPIVPISSNQLFIYTITDDGNRSDELIKKGLDKANEVLGSKTKSTEKPEKPEHTKNMERKCQCCPLSLINLNYNRVGPLDKGQN